MNDQEASGGGCGQGSPADSCIFCKKSIGLDETIVRTAVPSKALNRLAAGSRKNLKILWNEQSVPCFHQSCWITITDNADKDRLKSLISPADLKLVKDVEETAEISEPLSSLKMKAKEIAALMKQSSHTVVFTGAGISASAGIATYRGREGIDVVAHLGGILDVDKQPSNEGKPKTAKKRKQVESDPSIEASKDYLELHPTLSHQLINRWTADSLVHYVITQNCDDLHGRSGVPADRLSELHGNVFIEVCELCATEHRRPYCVDLFSTDCRNEPWYVRCQACRLNHFTGRTCGVARCRGRLRDTIVNFGDDLHATALGGIARAEAECRRAALALCVGSSLTVTPASELPEALPPGGAIVVVNLQATGLDGRAAVRVWGEADTVLALVQAELASPGPEPAAAPAAAGGSAARSKPGRGA